LLLPNVLVIVKLLMRPEIITLKYPVLKFSKLPVINYEKGGKVAAL
jgi:hypothetical protein